MHLELQIATRKFIIFLYQTGFHSEKEIRIKPRSLQNSPPFLKFQCLTPSCPPSVHAMSTLCPHVFVIQTNFLLFKGHFPGVFSASPCVSNVFLYRTCVQDGYRGSRKCPCTLGLFLLSPPMLTSAYPFI